MKADGGGCLVDGVVEVGGGDWCRWRDDRVRVGGVEAVQAQQDVEVDGSAGLEFGGFAVRNPDRGHGMAAARAVGDPHRGHATAAGYLAEVAFDGLFGAPPQLPSSVVPHDVRVVVVAVRAEGLAEPRITSVMAGEADERLAVLADAAVPAGMARVGLASAAGAISAGVVTDGPGVDRPEGRGGEGRENGRVGGDTFGDAFAADQPGADDVVGVAAVGLGAGRARGQAAVAAGLVDHAIRHVPGGDRAEELAGAQVDGAEVPGQPDRVGASGRWPDVIKPGEVPVTATGERTVGSEERRAAGGRHGHRR